MKKRVLIVDDNKKNLMLEKDLLEVAGFEVFEAQNGLDGIKIAKRELPDVIVMDLRLPDMRGSEAARVLRQDKATNGIPIIFVTASGQAGSKEEISLVTKNQIIVKPIDTRTFAKKIDSCLIKKSETLAQAVIL